jgi:hypothetical protein
MRDSGQASVRRAAPDLPSTDLATRTGILGVIFEVDQVWPAGQAGHLIPLTYRSRGWRGPSVVIRIQHRRYLGLVNVTKGVNVVKALRKHPLARLILLGAGTGLAATTVRAYVMARRLLDAVRHDVDPHAGWWLPPLPPAEPADSQDQRGQALSIPEQRSRSTAAAERAQPVRARAW